MTSATYHPWLLLRSHRKTTLEMSCTQSGIMPVYPEVAGCSPQFEQRAAKRQTLKNTENEIALDSGEDEQNTKTENRGQQKLECGPAWNLPGIFYFWLNKKGSLILFVIRVLNVLTGKTLTVKHLNRNAFRAVSRPQKAHSVEDELCVERGANSALLLYPQLYQLGKHYTQQEKDKNHWTGNWKVMRDFLLSLSDV